MTTEKAPSTHVAHSTCHEIEFLDGLGTHRGRSGKKSKRELLEVWLDTVYTRRWDSGVSVAACVNHADKLLDAEIKRRS